MRHITHGYICLISFIFALALGEVIFLGGVNPFTTASLGGTDIERVAKTIFFCPAVTAAVLSILFVFCGLSLRLPVNLGSDLPEVLCIDEGDHKV